MTRLTRTASHVAGLTLAASLAVSACGDDGDDHDHDHAHDAGMTESDTDAAVDASDSDATEDITPDVPTGSISIGGSIFNNTDTTEGTLRVAVVPADVEGAEPIAELEDDAPVFSYTWRFDDIPVGNYIVYALLDVDEPNGVTEPGSGDLWGRTEDPAGGFEDGAILDNINVEIR